MSKLVKPAGYKPLINPLETEQGIKLIKDFFQSNLSTALRLRRVTAPLFVLRGLGLNDDLNGVERPVSFPIKDMGEQVAEVVHSLAKWKRVMLAEYKIPAGYGLYTDMNAVRGDEELDNLHSLYVDQWDWERTINREEHKTILIVIHDLNMALRYCPQLVLLHKGGIHYHGTTEQGLSPENIRTVFNIHAEPVMADGEPTLLRLRPLEL